jgi:hypothetical protein
MLAAEHVPAPGKVDGRTGDGNLAGMVGALRESRGAFRGPPLLVRSGSITITLPVSVVIFVAAMILALITDGLVVAIRW